MSFVRASLSLWALGEATRRESGMLNGLFFTLLTFTLFKRVLGES